MDAMNDIFTQSHVFYHRSDVACTECAIQTKIMDGKSFSCHHENQTCLIYSTCHVKNRLLTSEWKPSKGWKHFCTTVHIITFGGDPWIDLGTLVGRRTSIRLKVKTTRDAYVGLASGNTTVNSGYWIVLGGWANTKSCLRDGFVIGGTCYSTSIASHLSGAQFTNFWIKWQSSRIEVGLGEIFGRETILDYTFPKVYQINNLLLRNAHSSQAEWIIYL
ncbi:uncharacterized protein LOC133196302 [Saccostrea echinata]|uniref:uncharacterized protein LOC133196302 n=1 Tax=Saccostrea echinata TaxID=191078 RepID=UPI002A812841|nr:uncharacterized protein LOC133196302 [Saccostrea echinata]